MTLDDIIGYFASIDTGEILVEEKQWIGETDYESNCLTEAFQSIKPNREE
ncbi:hypothetical protein LJB84_00070 [Bacteroidales bacterium OttesenSCG-928-J19]|nr:hypothetical protein [Bacteroidales bacterium OttesenSCG-928-J19]